MATIFRLTQLTFALLPFVALAGCESSLDPDEHFEDIEQVEVRDGSGNLFGPVAGG